jgi:hypothetical protein
MWAYNIIMLAGDSAEDNQTEAPRIDRMAGFNDRGKRFKERLGMFKALVRVLAQ